MKYFFILNPASRGGKSQSSFDIIFDYLKKKQIEYEFKETSTLQDAFDLSVYANKNGFDVIVAVGGDGTINKVLNGFYDENGFKVSQAKFGVIYTGTSPDFCKSYNIPIDIDNSLRVLLNGNTKKIYAGKITYSKANGDEYNKTSYFGCCVNIGLGAALARSANSGIRGYLGDFLGTFLSLIKTLFEYKPSGYMVSIEGVEKKFKNVFNLAIGKTFFIASGIKVENNLVEGDGRFYNLLVRDMKLFDIVNVLKKIYSGKEIVNNRVLGLSYCKNIEIYGCNKNNEIEFDGDPQGFLPCKIEMAKDPVDLICGV